MHEKDKKCIQVINLRTTEERKYVRGLMHWCKDNIQTDVNETESVDVDSLHVSQDWVQW
jgi:hypothetical protein